MFTIFFLNSQINFFIKFKINNKILKYKKKIWIEVSESDPHWELTK